MEYRVRWQAIDAFAFENDFAPIRFIETGNGIKHRRLAGTIGADKPENLAWRYVEGDAVYCFQSPKVFMKVSNREDW